jgi:hypothetical protein
MDVRAFVIPAICIIIPASYTMVLEIYKSPVIFIIL